MRVIDPSLVTRIQALKALVLLAAGLAAGLPAQTTNNTNNPRFGFRGPEIFPIDPQIGQLRAADLDGAIRR